MGALKRSWFSLAALGAIVAIAPQVRAQGAVITNGTISLGVFNTGDLNFGGVGIKNNANGHDGTIAGCPCEGWGVGISGGTFNGAFGGSDASTGQITGSLSVVSFSSTASTATSVTTISSAAGAPILRITHTYVPSAVPGLYQVNVLLENISGATLGVGTAGIRYRRLMDWDIPPTEFNEYVTIKGNGATNLLGTSDNGFETANVFEARRAVGTDFPGTCPVFAINADLDHTGPCDHGALFDFGFPSLGIGESRAFTTFYGAAPTETAALAALAAVTAENVYSFGQAGPTGTCTPGVPCPKETFIFGFKGVGGTPVSTVPEPGSLVLMGTGLLGLAGIARRRRSRG